MRLEVVLRGRGRDRIVVLGLCLTLGCALLIHLDCLVELIVIGDVRYEYWENHKEEFGEGLVKQIVNTDYQTEIYPD